MSDIDFDELDRAVSSVLGVSPQDLQPAPVSTPTPIQSATVTPSPVVPVTVTPTPAPVQPVRPVIATPRPTTGRFMDVVHPSSDMRTAPQTPQIETQDIPVVEMPAPLAPEPEVQSDPEDDAFELIQDDFISPLESPFLTDAKVEKRPLGAFSPEVTDEPVEQEELPVLSFDSTLEPSEEDLISAIEIGDTDPSAVIADEPQVIAETPVETEQPVYIPEPVAESEPEVQVQAFTPAIQPSITQQYTEQVSTDQQPSGAIFDTESYHQPLAHPQKKKSGVLVIVWILGLIVLGAGLGVSLYFFVLKGL